MRAMQVSFARLFLITDTTPLARYRLLFSEEIRNGKLYRLPLCSKDKVELISHTIRSDVVAIAIHSI